MYGSEFIYINCINQRCSRAVIVVWVKHPLTSQRSESSGWVVAKHPRHALSIRQRELRREADTFCDAERCVYIIGDGPASNDLDSDLRGLLQLLLRRPDGFYGQQLYDHLFHNVALVHDRVHDLIYIPTLCNTLFHS